MEEKRTHFVLRNKTLLVNHHRGALRAGHSSVSSSWPSELQPAAQRNLKLKETNNSVAWTVLLNSPPQAFGRWHKKLFLHPSPSHPCALTNRTLRAISQTPGMLAGRRGSSCRQEEHAKEPRSAQHTKPVLGHTNMDLSFISLRRKHFLDLGAKLRTAQVLLTLLFVRASSASDRRNPTPRNPEVSGSSFVCRSPTPPRAAEISSPGINELFPQMVPG